MRRVATDPEKKTLVAGYCRSRGLEESGGAPLSSELKAGEADRTSAAPRSPLVTAPIKASFKAKPPHVVSPAMPAIVWSPDVFNGGQGSESMEGRSSRAHVTKDYKRLV